MKTQRSTLVLVIGIVVASTVGAEPAFLRRCVTEVRPQAGDLSTATAHYRPIFGVGDPNMGDVKGLVCFGELTLDPGGSSKTVSHPDAEGVLFILAGCGLLHSGQEKMPVKPNDFVYLPVGVEHGVANPSQEPLRLLVMGFRVPQGPAAPETPKLLMASADEVQLQVLASHGPTTQFKLLLGTTKSTRDKLAAARQINSLFLMDFAPGGTNIPHRHNKEEEIYYVLRGRGDMVAGSDAAKKEVRYAAKEGEAYYFTRNTLIGFYSGSKEGEDHAQILAVRWPNPAVPQGASSGKAGQK
ncbi:MAG: cupin domain-containing protein [Planctomycetes bacterium]|jgi:mannose-6-phosphate isomerase-like protein (cupin superfamily)|nr:cupin domain-containing protein [Planctomycetota bacterium]